MERYLTRWWPLFLIPTCAAFLIGFLIPFALGLYLSFCDFTTLSNAVFTGLDNYVKAFSDASGEFVHALWYTALFAVVSTALINVLALCVALLLTRGFAGTSAFRTVFFLPNLIGGIVLGWLWQVLLNGLLAPYGATLVSSEWYGFWGLMAVVTWQQLGYMMIIYISGLTAIPDELMEAAAIDGATARQTFFHVKLPMLMPSVTICMPSNRSQLLALNIYSTFYGRSGWAGAGQAKAVIFCVIVVAIALLQLWLTRPREVQH